MDLAELTGKAPVIAMLGMCKNAGKTTALNRLIKDYALLDHPIALTSIGRDGESTDLVTGTEKPPIYLYAGMLAATAEQLLELSDVSREILDVLPIHTPLGRIVVFRAKSDGFVQLAGPSIVEQLSALRESLAEFGAETVIIDGALSRRSPAAGALDGTCVLSTGASLDRDMDLVTAETAFVCKILTLTEAAAPGPALDRFTIFRDGEPEAAGEINALCAALKRGGGDTVLASGALTDSAAQALLRAGLRRPGLRLILEDSSRLLVKRETFEKLLACGFDLAVCRGTRLAAVTVNPVSAGGWRFDGEAFLEKMRGAVPVPVLNVGPYDGTEL